MSSVMMSPGITCFVKDADHDVQELSDVFFSFTLNREGAKTSLKCSRVTLSLNLTLAQTATTPATKSHQSAKTVCELSGARRQALSYGTPFQRLSGPRAQHD